MKEKLEYELVRAGRHDSDDLANEFIKAIKNFSKLYVYKDPIDLENRISYIVSKNKLTDEQLSSISQENDKEFIEDNPEYKEERYKAENYKMKDGGILNKKVTFKELFK